MTAQFFNGLYFHPGVTFALHDLGIKVKVKMEFGQQTNI